MTLAPPPPLLRRFQLASSAGVGAGSPADGGPVTFPTVPLTARVRLGVGAGGTVPADLSADPATWNWLDISDRLRFDPGIDIAMGRRDRGDLVDTGEMTLRLDNTDGYLTRRNPNSPYYGLLTPNTPIWVEVNAGSGWKTRAQMFVNEWPTRWPDKSGNDCVVEVKCAGIMRRLQNMNESLKSPLRRAIAALRPTAYWSLEDGTDATFAASALPNGVNMSVNDGTVAFSSDGPDGSVSAVSFSSDDASMIGAISGVTAPWVVVVMSKAAISTSDSILTIRLSGSSYQYVTWGALFNASTGYPITATKPDGTTEAGNTSSHSAADWHYLAILGEDSSAVGGRISAWVDGVHEFEVTEPGTIGSPTQIVLNRPAPHNGTSASDGSVCHVAVFSNLSAIPDLTDAMNGFAGELAHDRIERLCGELDIAYASHAWTSLAMGPQTTDSGVQQLRDAEAVDGGTLHETGWGLGFLSSAERNNAGVSMPLNFNAGHISDTPTPDDDDRWLTNRWTCNRSNGGEFTAELSYGPLGIEFGAIEDSAAVNVETDAQLQGQAGWRVHLGTIDENRWSSLSLNFARNPDLIDTYASLPYGARTTLSNPPPEMPPDPVDVVVDGYSEHLDPKLWTATLNTFPASTYRVYTVASRAGNLGRLDSKLSYLPAAIGTGDTSILVATSGVIWDTTEANFDLNIRGERVTVTNITGASSPQTFTITRSVNGVVKSHPVAAKVSLWQPPVYALAG